MYIIKSVAAPMISKVNLQITGNVQYFDGSVIKKLFDPLTTKLETDHGNMTVKKLTMG